MAYNRAFGLWEKGLLGLCCALVLLSSRAFLVQPTTHHRTAGRCASSRDQDGTGRKADWLGRAAAFIGVWLAPGIAVMGPGGSEVKGMVQVEHMVAHAATGQAGGVDSLNKFLSSVRDIRSELQSEQQFDVVGFNKAFDIEKVSAAVDGALSTAQITDQTLFVEKRKVIDKVLRAVVSDVVSIEDTLRNLPESKTGQARLKTLNRPLDRLESDIKRLTLALTEEDSANAAGVLKPPFQLCPDGYLLCE